MDKVLIILDNLWVKSVSSSLMKSNLSWENLLDQLEIEFQSSIYHVCSPEWQVPPRILRCEYIHLIHSGQIECCIGDKTYRASAGEILFCPSGVKWSMRRISTKMIHLTVIHFHAKFPGGNRFLEVFNFPSVLRTDSKSWICLCKMAYQLSKSYRLKIAGHALKERALICDFFYLLFQFRGASAPVDRDGERVLKISDFIQKNFHQQITLGSLGKLAFLSANHLSVIFRQYTGRSLIDFLIEVRLKEAQRLLRTEMLTVAEICDKVGYEDPAYFSRLFKKHIKMSPAEYRQSWRSLT